MTQPDRADAQFNKQARLKAVDGERQVAVAAALVPSKVDYQGDWFRPEAIAEAADGYMERLQQGESEQGIMHAAFPEDDLSLNESRILTEPETIGEKEYPVGTWVVGIKAHSDEVWSLVEDGILGGVSIGGRITEDVEQSLSELPADVTLPDDLPVSEGDVLRQVHEAVVGEISLVDRPAVPDATVAMAKAEGFAKADIPDNREGCVAAMAERGHPEKDAERLCRVMGKGDFDAMSDEQEESGESEKDIEGVDDATLGKKLKRLLLGSGADDGGTPEDSETQKAGRTLSEQNQRAVMAAVDAQLDILSDAGVDHGMTRFSDRPEVDFDVADYGKARGGTESATNEDEKSMSETNENEESEKSLSEQNSERLDGIEEKLDKALGDEDAEKDEGEEKSLEDAPAWARDLVDKVGENADRIEDVAKANGMSQQPDDSEKSADDDVSKADVFGL